jgi:hypothetical protein
MQESLIFTWCESKSLSADVQVAGGFLEFLDELFVEENDFLKQIFSRVETCFV